MTPPTSHTDNLKLNPLYRLQWEQAQQAHVLLYPEGMVRLNQSAAEILKLCDGSRTLEQLITDLEVTFGTSGLMSEVMTFVDHARQRGWLTP